MVADTYEKFNPSLKPLFSYPPTTASNPSLKPLFSYPSHSAPIKCVAVAASDFYVSSSAEISTLLDHAGAVTALDFYVSSLPRNLISTSVYIYDVDPFIQLKTVMTHHCGINDLTMHPSGRLALTVGRDSCLSMLNLVRGKQSFYCRLDRETSIVRYVMDGRERFFIVDDKKVLMHSSDDAKAIHEMIKQRMVLSIALSEVLTALRKGYFESILPDIIRNCSYQRAYVRDGHITLFKYLSRSLVVMFQDYLQQLLPAILDGLANENELPRVLEYTIGHA